MADLSHLVDKYPAFLQGRTPTAYEQREIALLENIPIAKPTEYEQSMIDEVQTISSTPMSALEQKTRIRLSYSRESLLPETPVCKQDEIDVPSITKGYTKIVNSLDHLYAVLDAIETNGSQLESLLQPSLDFTTRTNSIISRLQSCTIKCVPKEPVELCRPLQIPSSLWNDTIETLGDITDGLQEFTTMSNEIVSQQEKYINELTKDLSEIDEFLQEVGETRRNCLEIAEIFQQMVVNKDISNSSKVLSANLAFRSISDNLRNVKNQEFFDHCAPHERDPLIGLKRLLSEKQAFIERQNKTMYAMKTRIKDYEDLIRSIRSSR